MSAVAASGRESVSALERGFAVLHCFKAGTPGLSHQQICRMTGLPKATVSRIVQTLRTLGYLDATAEEGRYALTASTLRVGSIYLAGLDVRAIARPEMAALVEATRGTVNLALRSDDHLVTVETMRDNRAAMGINSRIGFNFPILQTAIGRAYLAGLPGDARHALIDVLRPTVAPHQWKSLLEKVTRDVAACEANGFCTLQEEWRPGVNAVAAPLRSGGQNSAELYVMNCAGPAGQFDAKFMSSTVGPRLAAAVRRAEAASNVSWSSP